MLNKSLELELNGPGRRTHVAGAARVRHAMLRPGAKSPGPKLAAAAALAGLGLVTGCGSAGATGSSSSSPAVSAGPASHAKSGTLVIASFAPYSGPDASYGPEGASGAIAAIVDINAHGGVLGHKFVWANVDDRGDPADAVPAADKLIASTPNLVGIIGPDSNEATATVPIFNRAHIPMTVGAGQSLFDKTSYKYFWRNTPPDAAVGYAMAYYAARVRHCTTAAAVYATDVASQGAGPASVHAFQALGGRIVLSLSLSPGQPSYETEAEQVASAHPCAIFTEEDAPTGATFFKELLQLGGLSQVIGTSGTIVPGWLSAMKGALGAQTFAKDYAGLTFGAPNPSVTPAYHLYQQDIHTAAKDVESPASQWLNDPYGMSSWDAANEYALAMLMAHSVSPSVFDHYVYTVTQPTPGAVVVHDFAQGAAALAKGKKIEYVGALGESPYNRYHNGFGTFDVQNAAGVVVGSVTARDILPLVARFG
jgi:ABC-type branched-subunit amino acid transport system substrate-binding protein